MMNILKLAANSIARQAEPSLAKRALAGDLASNLESGLSVAHEPAAALRAHNQAIKSSAAARACWPVAPATPRIALRGVL